METNSVKGQPNNKFVFSQHIQHGQYIFGVNQFFSPIPSPKYNTLFYCMLTVFNCLSTLSQCISTIFNCMSTLYVRDSRINFSVNASKCENKFYERSQTIKCFSQHILFFLTSSMVNKKSILGLNHFFLISTIFNFMLTIFSCMATMSIIYLPY